jgi:hypothetical protein
MQRSAGIMSFFMPGHEMQEAQNKIQAFRLFAYVDQELRIPESRLESLDALAKRALALSNYRKIWALEGVAHYYANAIKAQRPERMLVEAAVPEISMVSMHAGMGTSFAGKVLAQLNGDPSKPELQDAFKRFRELCCSNARPNWIENAIEPIGLGVRTLYPHLLARMSDAIGEINEDAQRLYWHGAGRSLYFVPMNFMTFGGSHERALKTAISEAPTIPDRNNAVAGLVWAIALVNICHPDVLRSLLRTADGIRMRSAVINGIMSALMLWKHMVPEDREFLPIYTRPGTGNARDMRLWNEYVVGPASYAFSVTYPGLLAEGRIASLFEYKELYHE